MLGNVDKDELAGFIRRAKSSHIRWRAYAQAMVDGAEVDAERLPVKHTDCRFGQWYFGEGERLFGKLPVFSAIRGPHEMLHSVYEQIHGLMQQKRHEEAQAKLEQLIDISRNLLEQLERLESEVEAGIVA